MRTGILAVIGRVFAPVLSGILLVLAFPDYDVSWLAWIALVPLMLSLFGRTSKQGFLLCLLFSVVLFTGVCRWIFEVNTYSLIHHVLVNAILGLPLACFGCAFAFLSKRWGGTVAFSAAPFIWVALEYARSNLLFLSLPWAFLAHSQHRSLSVIQIASVTGTYGISFLIVLVNSSLSALSLTFIHRMERGKGSQAGSGFRRGAIYLAAGAAALVSLTYLYGQMELRTPIEGKEIRVSVLQGNIEQPKKWDASYRDFIMQRYAEFSREAARDKPALIIWPEAATPGFVLKDLGLLTQIRALIRQVNTHFLIGSSGPPKFKKGSAEGGKVGNTAVFFSPQGKVMGQYLKIILVPFAEQVPYEKSVPWPQFIVPEGTRSYDVPGREVTLFDLDGVKFGTLICWETIFPALFREFVKRGASFMINITNEGWFNNTPIYHQYVAMNVFRAVENRVFLVRCANTGVSCFIEPSGRVVKRVKDEKGQDIFVAGVLTGSVIPSDSKTIYTRYGDWLPWMSIGCSLVFVILGISRRNRA